MKEILWHGRGGQGAFTAAKILGAAYSLQGNYALAFPSFVPSAGYFLSRKKVTKERFKKRGISISPSERALRVRLTIFAKQKSVF